MICSPWIGWVSCKFVVCLSNTFLILICCSYVQPQRNKQQQLLIWHRGFLSFLHYMPCLRAFTFLSSIFSLTSDISIILSKINLTNHFSSVSQMLSFSKSQLFKNALKMFQVFGMDLCGRLSAWMSISLASKAGLRGTKKKEHLELMCICASQNTFAPPN